MKNLKVRKIILFIMAIIFVVLLSGIGTYAATYQYNASLIDYTPPSETTPIKLNVALNTLHNRPLMARDITKDDIGKTVTGYSPTGGGTWQLMYADTNNMYLIRYNNVNEPVGNVKTLAVPMNSSNSPTVYNFYGAALLTNYRAVNAGWLSKWMASSVATTSSNLNMKGVSYILDSGIWNPTYGVAGKSDWVIGSPTVEMLAKSYDKVQGNTAKFDALTVDTKGYDGYNVFGSNTLPQSTTTWWNHGEYYWLASPGGNDASYVLYVSYTYACVGNYIYSSADGFRPVVCLNSNVTFTRSGNNIVLN